MKDRYNELTIATVYRPIPKNNNKKKNRMNNIMTIQSCTTENNTLQWMTDRKNKW